MNQKKPGPQPVTYDTRVNIFAAPLGLLAFSPGGRRIASLHGTQYQIWDAASGRRDAVFEGHGQERPLVLAWSPDGGRVLAGGGDGGLSIRDAATGRKLAAYHGHDGRVYCAAWSPDGASILSGGDDGLQVWSVATGDTLARYPYDTGADAPVRSDVHGMRRPYGLTWGRGGTIAVLLANCVAQVWTSEDGSGTDLDLRAEVGEPVEHPGSMPMGVLSPDGRFLLVYRQLGLTIWGVGGLTLWKFSGPRVGQLTSIVWPTAGRIAWAGHHPGACDFEALARIEQYQNMPSRIRPERTTSYAITTSSDIPEPWYSYWSPDGTRLAVVSHAGEIAVWEAADLPVAPSPEES